MQSPLDSWTVGRGDSYTTTPPQMTSPVSPQLSNMFPLSTSPLVSLPIISTLKHSNSAPRRSRWRLAASSGRLKYKWILSTWFNDTVSSNGDGFHDTSHHTNTTDLLATEESPSERLVLVALCMEAQFLFQFTYFNNCSPLVCYHSGSRNPLLPLLLSPGRV